MIIVQKHLFQYGDNQFHILQLKTKHHLENRSEIHFQCSCLVYNRAPYSNKDMDAPCWRFSVTLFTGYVLIENELLHVKLTVSMWLGCTTSVLI